MISCPRCGKVPTFEVSGPPPRRECWCGSLKYVRSDGSWVYMLRQSFKGIEGSHAMTLDRDGRLIVTKESGVSVQVVGPTRVGFVQNVVDAALIQRVLES